MPMRCPVCRKDHWWNCAQAGVVEAPDQIKAAKPNCGWIHKPRSRCGLTAMVRALVSIFPIDFHPGFSRSVVDSFVVALSRTFLTVGSESPHSCAMSATRRPRRRRRFIRSTISGVTFKSPPRSTIGTRSAPAKLRSRITMRPPSSLIASRILTIALPFLFHVGLRYRKVRCGHFPTVLSGAFPGDLDILRERMFPGSIWRIYGSKVQKAPRMWPNRSARTSRSRPTPAVRRGSREGRIFAFKIWQLLRSARASAFKPSRPRAARTRGHWPPCRCLIRHRLPCYLTDYPGSAISFPAAVKGRAL
jgi:hypothetical protein